MNHINQTEAAKTREVIDVDPGQAFFVGGKPFIRIFRDEADMDAKRVRGLALDGRDVAFPEGEVVTVAKRTDLVTYE